MDKLESAHEYCGDHKSLIKNSTFCGCFYCRHLFVPSKINEWIDCGQTALCPFCGIDSVLPNFWGMLKDQEFLTKMYNYWFSRHEIE